jgi:ribulose-5-phosphate 4-epimerase/fuculose-1-phosphate aldolase
MAKHGTIYVGLVLDAVLNSTILSEKAAELVLAWPILGGKLLKQASLTPYSSFIVLGL